MGVHLHKPSEKQSLTTFLHTEKSKQQNANVFKSLSLRNIFDSSQMQATEYISVEAFCLCVSIFHTCKTSVKFRNALCLPRFMTSPNV